MSFFFLWTCLSNRDHPCILTTCSCCQHLSSSESLEYFLVSLHHQLKDLVRHKSHDWCALTSPSEENATAFELENRRCEIRWSHAWIFLSCLSSLHISAYNRQSILLSIHLSVHPFIQPISPRCPKAPLPNDQFVAPKTSVLYRGRLGSCCRCRLGTWTAKYTNGTEVLMLLGTRLYFCRPSQKFRVK